MNKNSYAFKAERALFLSMSYLVTCEPDNLAGWYEKFCHEVNFSFKLGLISSTLMEQFFSKADALIENRKGVFGEIH